MDSETSDSFSSYEFVVDEGSDVRNRGTINDVTGAVETNACSVPSAGPPESHLYPSLIMPEETADKTALPEPGSATMQQPGYPQPAGTINITQHPPYPARSANASGGDTVPPNRPPPQEPSSVSLPEPTCPPQSSEGGGTTPQHTPCSQPPDPEAAVPAGPPFQLPPSPLPPPQQPPPQPPSQPPPQPPSQPLPLSESSQPPGLSESSGGTIPQHPPFAPFSSSSSSTSTSQAKPTTPLRSDPLGALAEHQQGKEEEEEEDREYSVLLIGKTGNGKSSLGNTITGARNFKVGRGLSVTTTETQAESATVRGRRLKVIDTADFTNLRTERTTATLHVLQWKQLTDRCPDVIVLVVRCDVRYTKEEHDIYREIVKVWGDDSLFRQRLMVAFTFGDRQDEDLEKELATVNDELKSVLEDAQNRYVQVNNRARDTQDKDRQLQEICRVIGDVIRSEEDEVDEPPEILSLPKKHLAILIIGKTGQGKSSVGNLLTGAPDSFAVDRGLAPVTTAPKCAVIAEPSGSGLKVIDTPDLKPLDPAGKRREIEQWKKMTDHHPVVILLVVRCDVRVTSDELAVYRDVKEFWTASGEGPPFPDRQLIVVLTFCDYDLESQLEKCPELREVLTAVGDAYIKVKSGASEEQKRAEAQKLLSLIHEKGLEAKPAVASASINDEPPSHMTGERVVKYIQFNGGHSELGAVDQSTTAVEAGHNGFWYNQLQRFCSIQ